MAETIVESTFTVVLLILVLAHAGAFSQVVQAVTQGYSQMVGTLTSNAPFQGG